MGGELKRIGSWDDHAKKREDKMSCLRSQTNKSVSFLWIEHVDPNDGVGFACGASKIIAGSPTWENLAELATRNPDQKEIPGFPVEDKDAITIDIIENKAIISSQTVNRIGKRGTRNALGELISIKKEPHGQKLVFWAYHLKSHNKYTGWVAFNTTYEGDPDDLDRMDPDLNMPLLQNPSIDVGNVKALPNIYILSGHGIGGNVYSEDASENLGQVDCSKIPPFRGLKILIIASCSNVSRGNIYRYLKMFDAKGFAAIIGYEDTYSGGTVAAHVMYDFVAMVRSGQPVFESWKAANEKYWTSGKFPWAALFREKYRVSSMNDIMHDSTTCHDPQDGKSMPLLYWSSTMPAAPLAAMDIFSVLAVVNKDRTQKTYTQSDLKSGFNLRLEELKNEKNYLMSTGKSDCSANAIIVGRPDSRKFTAGTVFVLKLCVVRPNWKFQLDISKFMYNLEGCDGISISYPQSKFASSVAAGSIIRIDLMSDVEFAGIAFNFVYESIGYLTRAADGHTNDLVIYMIEGKRQGSSIILGDGTIFPDAALKEDPLGSAPSWWRRNVNVKDYSYYCTSFNPN